MTIRCAIVAAAAIALGGAASSAAAQQEFPQSLYWGSGLIDIPVAWAAPITGDFAVSYSGKRFRPDPIVTKLNYSDRLNSQFTVSTALWQQMLTRGAEVGASPATQGVALQKVVMAREAARQDPLTFAMVYPFSSHNYLLRYWLAAVGIHPDHDVRLVVLPPPLLVDAMREGQIDGFCVGEPWNSLAVSVSVGCIVAATAAIWHYSPEKVLACRLEWARRSPDQLSGLRALHRSAQWCSANENHGELARLLSDPRYVGAPADILLRGLSNELALVPAGDPQPVEGFYTIAHHDANYPRASHALWFYSQMVRWHQVAFSTELIAAAGETYRPDLYCDALGSMSSGVPRERGEVSGFFDQRVFEPGDVRGYLSSFGADND